MAAEGLLSMHCFASLVLQDVLTAIQDAPYSSTSPKKGMVPTKTASRDQVCVHAPLHKCLILSLFVRRQCLATEALLTSRPCWLSVSRTLPGSLLWQAQSSQASTPCLRPWWTPHLLARSRLDTGIPMQCMARHLLVLAVSWTTRPMLRHHPSAAQRRGVQLVCRFALAPCCVLASRACCLFECGDGLLSMSLHRLHFPQDW